MHIVIRHWVARLLRRRRGRGQACTIGTIQLRPTRADNHPMLNRLPKYPGTFAELCEDLGITTDYRAIAAALGVHERTVRRWKSHGAPRTALLALWWLSREGHSMWECEMHNRTALAVQYAAALAREGRLRLDGAGDPLGVLGPRAPANDVGGAGTIAPLVA